MSLVPTVPEYITVHLGNPDENAQNITVPFTEYLERVASSEIYPTWPASAIRANVLAQASFALNRIYTEYYRSRGYDFDITSTTQYDQRFIPDRDVFDNVTEIVDDLYGSYIRKIGSVEPLFASFCDGYEVVCDGLSQWGSVELANQELNSFEILKAYYGDDIEIVTNAPIENQSASAPTVAIREGDTGRDVELIQRRLNRISVNYPGIPKIFPQDGFFDKSTTDAVRKFQEVFSLTPDGIVGRETWYKIQTIYNAVKRLHDINSEGLSFAEISTEYPGELKIGDISSGVRVVQYYLNYIFTFVPTVTPSAIDGIFGEQTRNAVLSFQQTYGLPTDGNIDRRDFAKMQNIYYGLLLSNSDDFQSTDAIPFPGRILHVGLQGEDVRILQNYLIRIHESFPQIPLIASDGVFGSETERAVIAFERLFNLEQQNGRVNAITWAAIADVYEDLILGERVNAGQYPGYAIGG